jgi:hypothetical protein
VVPFNASRRNSFDARLIWLRCCVRVIGDPLFEARTDRSALLGVADLRLGLVELLPGLVDGQLFFGHAQLEGHGRATCAGIKYPFRSIPLREGVMGSINRLPDMDKVMGVLAYPGSHLQIQYVSGTPTPGRTPESDRSPLTQATHEVHVPLEQAVQLFLYLAQVLKNLGQLPQPPGQAPRR